MTVTAVFETAKDDKDAGIKDVQILPSEGVQKILHEGRLYIILPDESYSAILPRGEAL